MAKRKISFFKDEIKNSTEEVKEIQHTPVNIPSIEEAVQETKLEQEFIECTSNGIRIPITYEKDGKQVVEVFDEPDFTLYLPKDLAKKMHDLPNPITIV